MQQMQMMGMVTRSLKTKGQTLADETNLSHMMERKLLYFWKGKNLTQDFDASGAPRASYGSQMSRETHIDGNNTWDWEINNLNFLDPLIPKV
jgi:hypothetical protein